MKNTLGTKILYIGMVIFTIISALALMATYSVINQDDPFGPDLVQVMKLALLDMVSVSVLAIFFARKIYSIWVDNKTDRTSSSLQKKIIFIFGGIAAVPAIIIAILSTIILNVGINSWFNEKIGGAIDASLQATAAALNEHQKLIKLETVNISEGINYLLSHYEVSSAGLSDFLTKESQEKSLSEAMVFEDSPFTIIAMSKLSLPFVLGMLPSNAVNIAKQNILIIPEPDRVRVLIKLDRAGLFLLVSRMIDPQLLAHYERTRGVVGEYRKLDNEIDNIQIIFSLVFVSVSTIVLLISIVIGIYYASYITSPVINLVKEIGKVKDGDFSYRLKAKNSNDEIGQLSKSFNLMLDRIAKQHQDLLSANEEIGERKLFIEAILEGVPAGVIALDAARSIKLLNKRAIEILLLKKKSLIDKKIDNISPELGELIDKLMEDKLHNTGGGSIEHKLRIDTLASKSIINAKIILEEKDELPIGFIITLDDITALVSAERSSAWSDMARKIAHEVKNPLTPISLASNRLLSKFLNQVDDKEAFKRYVDTITKYAKEIARLIDEFINYAKLTGGKLEKINIVAVLHDSISTYKNLIQDVNIEFITGSNEVYIKADSAQIGQVMMNLLKNSVESIKNAGIDNGVIKIKLQNFETYVIITIIDNGPGFDKNVFDKIATPYLTTKPGGTGLGLAIVKKIIDDHSATIEFSNLKTIGACAKIKFMKNGAEN